MQMGCEIFKQRVKGALLALRNVDIFVLTCQFYPASLWLMVKRLLAMQETQVRSLGQKDPLEKETTTHSSILAWRIPSTEKPGGLQSIG